MAIETTQVWNHMIVQAVSYFANNRVVWTERNLVTETDNPRSTLLTEYFENMEAYSVPTTPVITKAIGTTEGDEATVELTGGSNEGDQLSFSITVTASRVTNIVEVITVSNTATGYGIAQQMADRLNVIVPGMVSFATQPDPDDANVGVVNIWGDATIGITQIEVTDVTVTPIDPGIPANPA